MMNYENTSSFAAQMDSEDSLAAYRERFYIPQHNGQDVVYLTGNSLGLQPKTEPQKKHIFVLCGEI